MTIRRSALVVAVLVLAACGTEATAPSTETTVPSETTTSAPTPTSAPEASAGFLSVGGCFEASVAVSAAMSTALAGSLSELGIEEETSPEIDLARLAADAPEEIADDLTVVADALGSYYEAIASSGIDFSDPASLTPDALAVMEEAAAALDTAEFRDASDRVAAWFEENCPAS